MTRHGLQTPVQGGATHAHAVGSQLLQKPTFIRAHLAIFPICYSYSHLFIYLSTPELPRINPTYAPKFTPTSDMRSVSPDGAKPALQIGSAEVAANADGKPVPVITVSNPAGAHGYLSRGRLRIVQFDASGKEVFRRQLSGPEVQQTIGYGLVGAGQTRRMTIPLELPQQGGRIEAEFTPD